MIEVEHGFERSMGNKNSAFETKLKAKAGDFFEFFGGGGVGKDTTFCHRFLRGSDSFWVFIGKRYIYMHCLVGFRGGRGLWIYIYIYHMFLWFWLHNCIP